MKVREFFFTDAGENIINAHTVFNAWAIGANHGYAEACKDHQEIVDALEWAIKQMPEPSSRIPGTYSDGYHSARAVLAKYKGE